MDGRMRRSDNMAPGYAQPPGGALRSPPDSPSPARTRRRCRDIRSQLRTCPRLPRGRSWEPGTVFVQVGYQVVFDAYVGGGLGAAGAPQSVLAASGGDEVVFALYPRQRRHQLLGSEVVGAFERVDRKILSSNQLRPPGYRSGLRSRSRTRSDRNPQ